MIRKKHDEVEWLEFELFAEVPKLAHGIFLRRKEGNAGWEIQGDDNRAEENRRCLQKVLQVEKFISGKHVHGSDVAWVKEPGQMLGDCDGMITDVKDLGLVVPHADCQGAIFYDPIRHAVAAVHAGWRGNVKNIYREAVLKMKDAFRSKPEDLLVGVSPSLGPDYGEFVNYKTELPEEFWAFQVRPLHFDLWAIARHQLKMCGILAHHTQIAEVCTYTHTEDFYSYRRDKVKSRNNVSVAILR